MGSLSFMGDVNTMFPGQKGGPGQFLGFTPTFDETKKSGSFQQLGKLGKSYSDLLLERLSTPPGETESFRLMSETAREGIGQMGDTQRQALSDRAVATGAFDAGQLTELGQGVDRAELQAFSAAMRQILIDLEDRRTEGVLPFLSGGAQESLGVQGLDFAKESARAAAEQKNFEMISSFFSPGGGTGAGAAAICWVAAATFDGWSDPRTHATRAYMMTLAPDWLHDAYLKYGRKFATLVKRSRVLRTLVKLPFTYFAWRGRRGR